MKNIKITKQKTKKQKIQNAEEIVHNINNYLIIIYVSSTTLNMRTNGMSLHKLPLFVWSIFVTAILLLLALPVLAGGLIVVPALNLANCWELLYNYFVIKITQSAGNLLDLNLLGIFRDYMPEFICCLKVPLVLSVSGQGKDDLILDKNSKFSYYLAGLIEGDGTIIVPNTERSIKGKLNYPSIQIVFNLKDLPLSLLIQKLLGNGSLSRKKGVNAYILTINNIDGLTLIVQLINGKLRTPKIYAFHNLIDWLNNKNLNLKIKKQELDNSSFLSNGWLSGFIEADGHFSVRTSMGDSFHPYTKLECKFELSQRQNDHKGRNNLFFLEKIALNLLTSVKSFRIDTKHPQYRIRTTSLKGNLNLVDYLNNYPLFGTKYLDYKDWLEVIQILKSGEHTKDTRTSAIEKIIRIKYNMNDNRTVFIWDHLQHFYNLDL